MNSDCNGKSDKKNRVLLLYGILFYLFYVFIYFLVYYHYFSLYFSLILSNNFAFDSLCHLPLFVSDNAIFNIIIIT